MAQFEHTGNKRGNNDGIGAPTSTIVPVPVPGYTLCFPFELTLLDYGRRLLDLTAQGLWQLVDTSRVAAFQKSKHEVKVQNEKAAGRPFAHLKVEVVDAYALLEYAQAQVRTNAASFATSIGSSPTTAAQLDKHIGDALERSNDISHRILTGEPFSLDEFSEDCSAAASLFDLCCNGPNAAIAKTCAENVRSLQAVAARHFRSRGRLGAVAATEQGKPASAADVLTPTAGYTPTELKAQGFRAIDLLADGYDVPALKAAQYTAAECLEANCEPNAMALAGFTVTAMRDAGLSPGAIFKAIQGLPLCDAINLGSSILELKACGFHAKELLQHYPLKALLASGAAAPLEFLQLGIDPADLKAAGASAAGMKTAGCPRKQLSALGYGLAELHEAGFRLDGIRWVGCTLQQLFDAGFTASDCRSAGFNLPELIATGFKALDLRSAGFSLQDLVAADFDAPKLKSAGYTAKELIAAGCTAMNLRSAAFTLRELVGAVEANARRLKSSGFSLHELFGAGALTSSNLNSVGLTAVEQRDVSFTANALRRAGFSAQELFAVGFNASELKSACFSREELVAAGLTLSDFISGGFGRHELTMLMIETPALRVRGA